MEQPNAFSSTINRRIQAGRGKKEVAVDWMNLFSDESDTILVGASELELLKTELNRMTEERRQVTAELGFFKHRVGR